MKSKNEVTLERSDIKIGGTNNTEKGKRNKANI